MTENKTNNLPVKAFRRGTCSAAVFANDAKVNGRSVEILKAHVQRRYKDKNNNWQSTSTYGINDIPKIVLCLQQAYEFMTENSTEDDASQREIAINE